MHVFLVNIVGETFEILMLLRMFVHPLFLTFDNSIAQLGLAIKLGSTYYEVGEVVHLHFLLLTKALKVSF